jgi:hypothetical protein
MAMRGISDPHYFDADPDEDPDPTCHFDADADPEPTFHFDPYPDPDPSFKIKAKILEKVLKWAHIPYITVPYGLSSANLCGSGARKSL